MIYMADGPNVQVWFRSAVEVVAHWPAEAQHVLGQSTAGGGAAQSSMKQSGWRGETVTDE